MSMRSSLVYGKNENGDWHGWEQGDEEDAFYLEFSDFKDGVTVALDEGPEVQAKSITLRMSLAAFKAIGAEYAQRLARDEEWRKAHPEKTS